jgi:TolB-like protein/DNA-binding winged helix-turn-helix (wHTH) protein/Tfp pilus assembly protein PilF
LASKPLGLPDWIRFGDDFELDVRAYELRSAGTSLKLNPIPMELLLFLIERRGELVTRDQIVERIWGKGVFLDSDNSINNAISKIRQVLRDDPEHPHFVQTVTGRGYRFIAPVAVRDSSVAEIPATDVPGAAQGTVAAKPVPTRITPAIIHRRWPLILGILLAMLVGLSAYVERVPSHSRSQTSGGRLMLAVLPFENLTGDASQDYFSDGLTEEMITQLGRIDAQRMGVIGRTSAMHYKHSSQALDQIGRELGVQYVLEGSVRRESNRVRITAQLIQVKDQTHLWAQEYDRELKDLLVLQGEIAGTISAEIEVALGTDKPVQPPMQTDLSAQNYEAYDLYLKGQYFWNKRTTEGFQRAIDYFQQAIAKDPNYARAYAGLADSYALIGGYSGVPQTEFMPKARDAALRAIELGASLPEAHTALALVVQNYNWDWQTAEKEYQRAIELDPNYATAHHWYAEHLALRGRFDEALRESERARRLDPLSLIIAADNGVILYYARQYDRALAQFRAVREMDPHFSRAGMIREVYSQKGMFAEILAEDDQWQRTVGDAHWILAERACVYGRSGQQAQARLALEKLKALNREHPIEPALFVEAYIGMDNKDQAFIWLERAFEQHSNCMTTLKVDPLYDPLRSDPRFQDLLRRVGLAQ